MCVYADVWYTCAEMLDIGAGNQQEHAVLLCNYLLTLEAQDTVTSRDTSRRGASSVSEGQWRSYVVLGKAAPAGTAVWVLRRHKFASHVVLINAVTVRLCACFPVAPCSHVCLGSSTHRDSYTLEHTTNSARCKK